MKRKEIITHFAEHLSHFDETYQKLSFVRKGKSVAYYRRGPSHVNKFNISLSSNPSWRPSAIAWIDPMIWIELKDVSSVASDLVGENLLLLANAPKILLNFPMSFLLPLESRVKLYATETKDFAGILETVTDHFLQYGLPFFDSMSSADGVINQFESGNLISSVQDKIFLISVMASYIVLGRFDSASSILETSFSKPGARRKYAVLFENLPEVIAKYS